MGTVLNSSADSGRAPESPACEVDFGSFDSSDEDCGFLQTVDLPEKVRGESGRVASSILEYGGTGSKLILDQIFGCSRVGC